MISTHANPKAGRKDVGNLRVGLNLKPELPAQRPVQV